MVNDHTKDLNTAQKEAVLHLEGPLLIVAGAGAGKTKTITHRILNLIHKGTAPEQILAITFTNKAAKEMRERVERLINEDTTLNLPLSHRGKPFVSTFHALGVHILKENAAAIGLTRHFTIFDRNDSKGAVKEALEQMGLDPKLHEPAKILHIISRQKGNAVSHQAFAEAHHKDYTSDTVARVWEHYETILKKEHALDFDDLLLKTVLLLKREKAVLERYQSQWKYIHIDEYQDTNKVQYELSALIAQRHRNICVVGDVDQNIYSWRGADIENLLNFEKDYPDAKVVLLEENYRSTQTILAAANSIIEKNKMRKEKRLFTKNKEGELISLRMSLGESDEANAIADKSRELIASGVEPKEIAVLYRANFQSRVLEEAFLNKNIPYQILGTRFFDRKEIKDVLSFIRAALNPESLSDIKRVINVPPRGVGRVTLLKIFAGGKDTLGDAMGKKVADFFALLEKLRGAVPTHSPSNLIKFVLKETGIEIMYREGKYEDSEKLENLRELVTLALKYDSLQPEEGIEKLLADAALATDQDELAENRNAVKLMTVHAAKGLEFDYVFVPGLEEDLFPHKKINEENITMAESEEERRLFYVAITRARKKLFLSYAQIRTIYGSQKVNSPSEFIADIDDSLLEKESYEEPTGVKAIFIDF
jgi:DNA helicase II / ATP-dependent DNA helicase PcrA